MYLKKGFELESWRANHTKQWSPENIFQELKRFAKTIEDYLPSRTPLPPFQLFDWSFSYCHHFQPNRLNRPFQHQHHFYAWLNGQNVWDIPQSVIQCF